MYKCDLCGAEFEEPLVLDTTEPRGDCFSERFRRVGCPYCGGPYFNEMDEEAE